MMSNVPGCRHRGRARVGLVAVALIACTACSASGFEALRVDVPPSANISIPLTDWGTPTSCSLLQSTTGLPLPHLAHPPPNLDAPFCTTSGGLLGVYYLPRGMSAATSTADALLNQVASI